MWTEVATSPDILHLLGVLCTVSFDVSPAGLYEAVNVDAFKGRDLVQRIQNVLTVTGVGIRIYHNSFRQYVLKQLDQVQKDQLEVEVLEFLKRRKGSAAWYGHIARFALSTGDYGYVKTLATPEFVDQAIRDGRPFDEISATLVGSVRACVASSDPVSLAHTAQLHSNTVQRLQYNLDKHLLFKYWMTRGEAAKALSLVTTDGRLNDFSIETAQLLLDLADGDSLETGKQLALEFLGSFEEEISSSNVTTLSLVLATYAKNSARWIAGTLLDYGNTRAGNDEETLGESLLPRLFDIIYKYEHFHVLRPIKRALLAGDQQPFWKDQVYYNIAVCEARYHPERAESHVRAAEARVQDEVIRTRLAGLSARLGLDANLVVKLLGSARIVPSLKNDSLSYFTGKRGLEHFRDYSAAITIANRAEEIHVLKGYLGQGSTWMSEYYLANLQLEEALCSKGSDAKAVNEILFGILDRLTNRKTPRTERIYEVFSVVRKDLPEFLRRIIEGLIRHGAEPDRVVTACSDFGSSDLISVHYGIGGVVASYENEISMVRTLSRHRATLPHLKLYMYSLHDKIRQKTLETQTRSEHCLRLADLAAYCQFGDTSADWFGEAIAASKGYGYHKDITISVLIDVMELANEVDPAGARRRIADIADLNRWLPRITDGKETHWFEISLFDAVQKLSNTVALNLLPTYREVVGYSKFSECLQRYLTSFSGDNIGLAYVLSELVDECKYRFEHPWNGKTRARIALVDKAAAHSDTTLTLISEHLRTCLTTVVSPNERRVLVEEYNEIARKHGLTPIEQYWFVDSSDAASPSGSTGTESGNTFEIDGKKVSQNDLIELMRASVTDFCRIADQVKNSDQHYLVSGHVETLGLQFLQATMKRVDLEAIAETLLHISHHDAKVHLAIAEAYERLGEHSMSLWHRRLAFESLHAWGLWDKNLGYIDQLFEEDEKAAMRVVMETVQTYILQYNTGFGAPLLLAKAIKRSRHADLNAIIDIYNDYWTLTKEQFADLPQKKSSPYDWLREGTIETRGFDEVAFALLSGDLIDPQFHRRFNLIHLIGDISLVREEMISQLLIPCLRDDNETRRMLASLVIDFIACNSPNLLEPYLTDLVDALTVPNANVNQSLVHALENVKMNLAVPATFAAAIDSASRANPIPRSIILLNGVAPSKRFRDTQQRLNWFSENAVACAELMDYDLNELYWRIEQEALKHGYDYGEAEEYDEDLARSHIHPQGAKYSFVPFESYSTGVFANSLLKVVDAILRSGGFDGETRHAVGRRLRYYDPSFPLRRNKPLPQEYLIPCVEDSSGKTTRLMQPSDWFEFKDVPTIAEDDGAIPSIPLYEHYYLIQGSYIETCLSSSHLVPIRYADRVRNCNAKPDVLDHVLLLANEDNYFTVTREEAQELIQNSRVSAHPLVADEFPLLVLHKGHWWLGHPYEIAGLVGTHIKKHDLVWKSYDSLDMTRNREQAVNFDIWQDGFDADTYTYKQLSSGTRLSIARSLLDDILKETEKTLLTVKHYTRRVSEDKLYGRQPEFKPEEKTVFRLYQHQNTSS